jgi:hypothetical protein
MKKVYFKSFGRRKEDLPLETSLLNPHTGTLSTCQTLVDVLKQKIIRPNTVHHVLNTRLSVSVPTEGYSGAHRPEGLLFTTEQQPSYCSPFDLMALTYGKTFTLQDYGSDFLPDCERFIFTDGERMERQFSHSRHALTALNELRRSHNLPPFDESRAYNEFCFEEEVKINPVGLIGTSDEVVALSDRHRVKRYDSVGSYLRTVQRKRDVRDLLTAGLPATLAASALLALQASLPKEVQERIAEPYALLGQAYFQK